MIIDLTEKSNVAKLVIMSADHDDIAWMSHDYCLQYRPLLCKKIIDYVCVMAAILEVKYLLRPMW